MPSCKLILLSILSVAIFAQPVGGKNLKRSAEQVLSDELLVVNRVVLGAQRCTSTFPTEQENNFIKKAVGEIDDSFALEKIARLFDWLWRDQSRVAPSLSNRLEYGFWAAAEELAKKTDQKSVEALSALQDCRDGAGSIRLSELIKVQKGLKTYEYYQNGKQGL